MTDTQRDNPIIGEGTSLQAWQGSEKLAQVPVTSIDQLVPPMSRAVIVAPHPDDEVLGFGGLMQQLAQLDRGILLISVTDGCASHPGSERWTQEKLRAVRPQESAEALHRMDIPPHLLQWVRGSFPDTGVERYERDLGDFLQRYLRPTDVVFTTWAHDGHTDHEATGRATRATAEGLGIQVHEVPIWAWHWAAPEDDRLPWNRARKVLLAPETIARKRHAAQAFASQLEGDPDIGLAPVLPPWVLERLLRPFELVFL